MKRLAALVLCAYFAACASLPSRPPTGKRAAASARAARQALDRAGQWVVDIHELVPALRPMPQKEREDQLRDWALYGLLMRLGLEADELARATHQLAPMRFPYLEELFVFDYGPGRRAILSDERVLLLYEQDDPDPQATLGRLADRVRMEIGRVPGSFELYAFAADVSADKIWIDRREVVSGAALFSKEYGYSEAVVVGRDELAGWLAGVDDVTYVARAPGGMKLGGRRFEKSRTRTVSLEDVAALYQAHAELAARVEGEIDRFTKALSTGHGQVEASVPAVEREVARLFPHDWLAQRKEVYRRLNERWRQVQIDERRKVTPVPAEPGFSLDFRYRASGFAAAMEELAADPCRALDKLRQQSRAATARLESTRTLPGTSSYEQTIFERDPADLNARCRALGKEPYRSRLQAIAKAARALPGGAPAKEALAPFHALRSELKTALVEAAPGTKDETRDFVLAVLGLAEEANRQQCARYDGPLGGTRVGMNLFYTDLLAKLWLLLDAERSAPGMRVPGFVSMARLPPSAFWKEDSILSEGRIWFGLRQDAVTRAADDSELSFQHVATRVFSAGSDPDHPEYKETVAPEDSRRAIGWWERHYADVANYEQEYHLQNQIMKWSVITGFFRAKGFASYLREVPVDRTAQFGRWYAQARPGLKYALPLVVEGGAGQECLEVLSARDSNYYGGVALAGSKLVQVPALATKVPASIRLTSAVTSRAAAPASTGLGRALPILEQPTLIRVNPLGAGVTRARMAGIQMELGTVELSHVKNALGYQLTLGTTTAPMGSFTSAATGQAVRLGWQPGQVARAPELVQRITSGERAVPVSVDVFRESASKSAAAPSRSWPSPLHVHESYDVLVPDAVGNGYSRVRLSNAPDAHAAPAKLSSVLESYRYQRYSMDRAASGLPTSQGVARTATNVGPGPGAQKIQIQGLEGYPEGLTLVTDGKALFVPRPSGAAAQAKWHALDRSAPLTQRELNEIWNASLKGERTVRLTGSRAEQAARAIAGGDQVQARSLIEGLSKDLGPERGPQLVREHLEAAGDFQLTRGDPTEASHLYKLAQELGDAPPDVLIRRTVADLSAGKSGPNALEQVLERHAARLPYEERVATYKTMQGLEQDMPDVAVLTGVKLGARDLVPPEVVPLVRLERDGPDVLLALRRDRPLGGEAVAKGDLGRVIPEDASVYVEDGFSFNKNDFQLNPAMNVSELGNNPAVEVVRIREMGTGNFRPGKVYVKDGKGGGDRAYRRASGPIVREKTGGDIFFIQLRDPDKCDKDEDGELSAEERRDCQVP